MTAARPTPIPSGTAERKYQRAGRCQGNGFCYLLLERRGGRSVDFAAFFNRAGPGFRPKKRLYSFALTVPFDRKKDAYFANGGVSPFLLTTQVLSHDTWTPDIVAGRQAELSARLAEHWRLQ